MKLSKAFIGTLFETRHILISRLDGLATRGAFIVCPKCSTTPEEVRYNTQKAMTKSELERTNHLIDAYFATQEEGE